MANRFDESADDAALTGTSSESAKKAGGGRYKSLAEARRERELQEEEEGVDFYEAQIDAALQSSLDSTKRSLKALEESESVGVGTAQVGVAFVAKSREWSCFNTGSGPVDARRETSHGGPTSG